MADKPKPFLKKGTGAYTKISYPVLRRSGTYQPPPDTTSAATRQRSPAAPATTTRQPPKTTPEQRRAQASAYLPAPGPSPAPALAPLLAATQETGLLGARSPTVSLYSSAASDSPPAPRHQQTGGSGSAFHSSAFHFGSSADRRAHESDEGVAMSASPGGGLPSGRPRTAGTIDSGFPREEPPQLSPASNSSSGAETRAPSSIPSLEDDGAHRRSPATPAAASGDEEEEVMVEPTVASARPVPAPRNRSAVGTTTEEFVRLERVALRDEQANGGFVPPPLSVSSRVASPASTLTSELRGAANHVIHKVRADEGEEPYYRRRLPYGSTAGAAPPPAAAAAHRQERMIGARLDESGTPSSTPISPIDGNPEGRPRNYHEFTGASFRESDSGGSRPGSSSSHFRVADSSAEAAVARGERTRQRLEQLQMQSQQQQQPAAGRRRSQDESSEASSSSTAAAERYLMGGDRRPLSEVGREITGTQQRPRNMIRPSQATRRSISIEEEPPSDRTGFSDEEESVFSMASGRGVVETRRREQPQQQGGHTRQYHHHSDHPGGVRREETVRGGREEEAAWRKREQEKEKIRQGVGLMKQQLIDAIAHNDLGDATLRRMKEELQATFEGRLRELAALYAAREKALEDEARRAEGRRKEDEEAVRKIRSELENEKRLLKRSESAKVKELEEKLKEEQKKYEEEKKRRNTDDAKRRIVETKAKTDRDAAAATIECLRKDKERLQKFYDEHQRGRATARGQSALRAAYARAEEEAAAAPRRGRAGSLPRFGGPLADKENRHPSVGVHSTFPAGILKNVRFEDAYGGSGGTEQYGTGQYGTGQYGHTVPDHPAALDTTFTVPVPEVIEYEIDRYVGKFGLATTVETNYGNRVRAWTPACGCVAIEYAGDDFRHYSPDRSVKLSFYAASGIVTIGFFKQRCEVRCFTNDDRVEIWRTGAANTYLIKQRDGTIGRVEQMVHEDGTKPKELWKNNSMAIQKEGERFGAFVNKYQCGNSHPSKKSCIQGVDTYGDAPLENSCIGVTKRQTSVGKSEVALHSNNDLEFFEPYFYMLYCAQRREIQLRPKCMPDHTYYITPGQFKIQHEPKGGPVLCCLDSPRLPQ